MAYIILGAGESLKDCPGDLINNENNSVLLMNDVFELIDYKNIKRLFWFQLHGIQAQTEKNFSEKCFEIIDKEYFSYLRQYCPNLFFTSTASIMLFFAIDMIFLANEINQNIGLEDIYLFGIDCVDEDYQYQLECINYWVGFAQGLGIKVHIPEKSKVCKSDFVYMLDEEKTIEFTKKIWLKKQLKMMAV